MRYTAIITWSQNQEQAEVWEIFSDIVYVIMLLTVADNKIYHNYCIHFTFKVLIASFLNFD